MVSSLADASLLRARELLDFYYNLAPSYMGQKSNYGVVAEILSLGVPIRKGMLSGEDYVRIDDGRLLVVSKRRQIQHALDLLGREDQLVLYVLFEGSLGARIPIAIRDRFGEHGGLAMSVVDDTKKLERACFAARTGLHREMVSLLVTIAGKCRALERRALGAFWDAYCRPGLKLIGGGK
jgi:hypothetical protein